MNDRNNWINRYKNLQKELEWNKSSLEGQHREILDLAAERDKERALVDCLSITISKMLLCSEPELTLVAKEALQLVKEAKK